MLASVAAVFALQVLAWGLSVVFSQGERFYDLSGGLTYLLIVAWGLIQTQSSSPIVGLATAAWAARLSGFLFYRIVQSGGEDSRFRRVRGKPHLLLIYWLVQGVWCTAVLLPFLLTVGASHASAGVGPVTADTVGMLCYVAGMVVEIGADLQKHRFRAGLQPGAATEPMVSGFFSVVRYPQYSGEILLQTGVAMMAIGAGSGVLALVSPVFTAVLLTRVSGIPLQEKQQQRRFEGHAGFKRYRQRVRFNLVPGVW
jgi:steroid 5-alpha reductase family enzyme